MTPNDTGRLPEKLKSHLVKNMKEMSLAQGNILSAGRGVKSIFVTSCFNGEGKTTAAVSLAYGLTMSGNTSVLLVDGNQAAPQLHNLFSVSATPGLTEMLDSDVEIADLVHGTEYRNMALMTFGAPAADSGLLARSGVVREKLDLLKQSFDYIIFDGHAIMGSSEAALIANQFDGVIMVIECEKTKWEVAQMAIEKLRMVNGNVIGVILNKRRYYIPKVLYGKV